MTKALAYQINYILKSFHEFHIVTHVRSSICTKDISGIISHNLYYAKDVT